MTVMTDRENDISRNFFFY